MMNTDNLVILRGNLGKDPKVRYSQKGLCIVNFSIATKERYKDKDGNQQEQTTWHNIRILGDNAEYMGNNLAKGTSVFIVGKLRNDQWENENGRQKYDYVLARRVRILEKKAKAA